MVNSSIPPTSGVLPVGPASNAVGNNIIVETTVNSAPDKIQQLMRQIEVSGTLAQPPAGNTVTLNTVIGPLVLLLPSLLQAQQDKLLQQLIALFQNQKPLTVVLQPGNPPAQAFLLLPPATGSTQNPDNALPPLSPLLAKNFALLQPNTVLSAIVLPNALPVSSGATGPAGQIAYSNPNPFSIPSGAAFNLSVGVPLIETLENVVVKEALAKLGDQTASNLPPPAKPVASKRRHLSFGKLSFRGKPVFQGFIRPLATGSRA